MKFNALQVRQEFGKILKKVQKSGEPAIIEKGRQPVAVLISMDLFKKRFVDYREKEKRDQILAMARSIKTKPRKPTLEILRALRYGKGY